MPEERWSDDYARRIVRTDFAYAESYRTNAHDWRYRNASELYLAWAGQRYWEGTRIPRSSLGIFVVFEQVESMLPKIVGSLCDSEGYNFYARRSDQDDAALAWRRLVLGQLDDRGINFREQIRLCAKSSLIYGNGICEVGVEPYREETVEFSESKRVTSLAMVPHPMLGMVPVPQGFETKYSRKTKSEVQMRPYVRYRSIIDFYVNPNCETTVLQSPGNYTILRDYVTAEDVKELGQNDKRYKVPSDEDLHNMSKAKTTANQDVTKLSAELFRYNMWNPSQDYSGDPGKKRIERIEYTTKDRKVQLLNRDKVFYNEKNGYGEINYFSMHYADVLDRWHALAISDVAEGEQRLQQSIINARVDELALSIHTPMVKRRGVTIPPYQLKVRPGVVIETENPEGDIVQLPVANITQQAYIEVQASEQRVQGMTGITDIAATGAPSAGNSANRTATGINTQAQATGDRTNYYVETSENIFMEPVMNAIIRYDKKFIDIEKAASWMKADPDFAKLNFVDVANTDVFVECRGSIKNKARFGFLQLLPQTMQFYLNPEFLQLLSQQQKKTVDVMEFARRVDDAINYEGRNPLFIDLSDDEKQAMQQPPPAEKLQAMMQQMQQQSDEKIHGDMNMTKLMGIMIKEFLKKHTDEADADDQHSQALLSAATTIHATNTAADTAADNARAAKTANRTR